MNDNLMIISSLFTIITLSFFNHVNSQALTDFRPNNFNSLQELVNPSWRRHRSRFRPFSQIKGAPMYNIRGSRSVDNQMESHPSDSRADCVVADEILSCFGMIKQKQEAVSCDITEDFANSELTKYDTFTMSELRIMITGESKNIVKLYLYGRIDDNTMIDYRQKNNNTDNRSIFTLHSKADALNDRGITVLNPKCWETMIQFFKGLESSPMDKVTIKKETLGHQQWNENTPVIANLRLL